MKYFFKITEGLREHIQGPILEVLPRTQIHTQAKTFLFFKALLQNWIWRGHSSNKCFICYRMLKKLYSDFLMSKLSVAKVSPFLVFLMHITVRVCKVLIEQGLRPTCQLQPKSPTTLHFACSARVNLHSTVYVCTVLYIFLFQLLIITLKYISDRCRQQSIPSYMCMELWNYTQLHVHETSVFSVFSSFFLFTVFFFSSVHRAVGYSVCPHTAVS